YDLRATDTPICDRGMRTGWYTFVDVNGRNTCGTVTPIWLNGDHPTENGKWKYLVCFNPITSFLRSCCDEKMNILVKKCNGFYVYLLIPPTTCPSSFCA
ncbi:unnamed protein product, partial [Candidula unifasciata]